MSFLPHSLADVKFCLIGSTIVRAGGEAAITFVSFQSRITEIVAE